MEWLAQALVRWRWFVITLWAIAGFFALRAAPDTPALLNLRGGSNRPTEAGHADSLIRTAFPKPLSEFFAVTIESPALHKPWTIPTTKVGLAEVGVPIAEARGE